MASDPHKTNRAYIDEAKAIYQADGELEIDEDATVSRNDDAASSHGAYVQAWVWVGDQDKCHACGEMAATVVVPPNGRELCHACFRAGVS